MMNMKRMKYFLAFAMAIILAAGCNEGIDPISQLDPEIGRAHV